MLKISSIILGAFVFTILSGMTVGAQAVQQQQTNQLQSPSSTQSTQSLQNQQSQIQQNDSAGALSGGQRESLKVLSSPSQTDSSVSVGRSSSTTKSDTGSGNNMFWLAALLIPLLAGAYLFFKTFLSPKRAEQNESDYTPTEEPVTKTPKKEAKSVNTIDEKTEPEIKKSSKKSAKTTATRTKSPAKKKKKKNHR